MQEREELFRAMARPAIRGLEPYDATVSGEPKIRVSANENNEGLPPSVLAAMRRALAEGNRYPDSRNAALREKLAARFALTPAQIITANGLDGFFTMLGRAFLDPGCEVVCGECTFSVYADTARIAGAAVKKVPLGRAYEQRPEDFAAAVSPATKMLFFCNPNNPTGTLAETGAVRAMLEKIPRRVAVILDEAYVDFAEADGAASFRLLEEFPNLIVCRTFSKIFALAGLRVGWAAGDPALLDYLYRVREPYCVTAVAEAGACAALDEAEYLEKTRRLVARERGRLCALLSRGGVEHIPSQANFVLIFPKDRYDRLSAAFAQKGIAVRSLSLRGERVMRISVGLPEENRQIAGAIGEIFEIGQTKV
ncbi:MAG: histidinol-phosphate transaminase [bacterium]|nr:histidinol-phosphate transaminase [bacterium]